MYPSGSVADVLPDFAEAFPFSTFNDMQQQALPALLENNENVVISAPTGAGKTALAEIAICRCLSNGGTALFLAPLRALTAEKEAEWERFADLGYQVYVVTGDRELSPRRAEQADILVMTPEKLDSATRKPHSRRYGFVGTVDCCVIDEVHLLGSARRGSALEVTIARLRRQTNSRVVALSAALANPRDIADWLDAPETNTIQFGYDYRPVPLETGVATYTPGENSFASKYHRLERALSIINPHLIDDGQAIIFVASRQDARRGAEKVATELPTDSLDIGLGDDYDALSRANDVNDASLSTVLRSGVAFHHAGLSRADRELVESWFKQGNVSVLVSTSTLAWGVNLPARCVVVRDIEYHDPLAGSVPIRPIDIRQMVGRAGRPGYDSRGYAWVIAEPSQAERYEQILTEDIEVTSNLIEDLATHLNAEICLGAIDSTDAALNWLQTTYLAAQDPAFTPEELLNETIEDLLDRDFITLPTSGSISSTPLGDLAATFYLRLSTAEEFCRLLENDAIETTDVLETVALAAEFESVHARKSEREAIDALVPSHDALSDSTRKVMATLQSAMDGEIPGPLRADGWAIKQNANRLFGALRACCRRYDRPLVEHLVCRLEHRIEYGISEEAVGFTALDGVGGRRAMRLTQTAISYPWEIADLSPDTLAAIGFGENAIDRIHADAADLPQPKIEWSALPSAIERTENQFLFIPITCAGSSERANLTVRVNDYEMHQSETRLGSTEVPIAVHAGEADSLEFSIEIVFPDSPIQPYREQRVVAVTEGLKEIG